MNEAVAVCVDERWELLKKEILNAETQEERVFEIVRGGKGYPTLFVRVEWDDVGNSSYHLIKIQIHHDDRISPEEGIQILFAKELSHLLL